MANLSVNPRTSSALRRIIQIIGILITLLALGFAFQRIWTIGRSNWEKLLSISVLLVTILGGIAHGLNEILQGWAWQKLLVWFGETKARPKISLAVYGRTQIVKYLPGNIFQYPSRHVAGNRAGFNHTALVGAMIYEIVGLLVAAGTISLIGFPITNYLGDSIYLRLAILPIIILLPVIIQSILVRFPIGKKLGLPNKSFLNNFKGVLPIWMIYFIFFLFDGVIFWCILVTSTGKALSVPFMYIFSTFTLSWVIGFITPGAPAGLGVRESIMILILTNFIGQPTAAFVALISRLVVTIGDLVFFLFSYLLPRKLD
jgi:glycosyltransferase 2 family protein